MKTGERKSYFTGKEIKMDYMNKSLLNSVGLSYGELSLKGKNRGQFEKMLKNKINKALSGYEFKLNDDLSKLYVDIKSEDRKTEKSVRNSRLESVS